MNGKERRKEIVTKLLESERAISASSFAKNFGVSRQVIVGDIALIRASSNLEIVATASGYIIAKETGIVGTLVCRHRPEEIQEELETILSLGGVVLDVFVEHPLYGTITVDLRISNMKEMEIFLKNRELSQSSALLSITEGIHSHHILVRDQEMFHEIQKSLREKKLLFEE